LSDDLKIDPWSTSAILDDDYERLIREFGIQKVGTIEREKMNQNRFFRRKIIFGHRDLDAIFKAMEMKKPWAVMSGIKPSGPYHLGTLTTALEIVEFQKMGAKAYYGIADIESWEDNGITYKDAEINAVDNLADILALGLDPDPKKAYIWRQSEERIVKDIAFKVGRLVTYNMLKAIYGVKSFGLYLAALIQVGDIVLPQIIDGPEPTIVPVGIDQDPHLRLTRDLTRRYYKDFFLPGATYHKLIPGLDGSDKMSKKLENYFTFDEPPNLIKKKIKNAFTGGRKNKEEQRKLGGKPEVCMIYKIEMYNFEKDDKKLEKIYKECVSGQLMCGDHKEQCIEKVLKFIEEHKKKKDKFIDKAREILKIN
jgi:tryptophanyl-tRNA synthetase